MIKNEKPRRQCTGYLDKMLFQKMTEHRNRKINLSSKIVVIIDENHLNYVADCNNK